MHRYLKFLFILLVIPGLIQAQVKDCDGRCLENLVDSYLAAIQLRNYSDIPWGEREQKVEDTEQEVRDLPWGNRVRFTENDVALMIGDGLWGTATAIVEDNLVVSDPGTGNVIWLGVVEEHGLPAYLALRLKVQEQRIVEVESVVGREGTPGPFAKTDEYRIDNIFSQNLPRNQRRQRERMIALVDGYYNSLQLNDGELMTGISNNCSRRENGLSTTHGSEHWAAAVTNGCKQQLENGLFKSTDSIRHRRYPVVNEETGVVVALSLHDQAVRYTEYKTLDGKEVNVPVEYPNTLSMLEVFKIVNGEIRQIEAVSAFQPYLMPTIWR